MTTIEVFEPAMCCRTGVCGPDVPQELVTFSADFDWLRGHGQDIARYNLASEPTAFADRPAILDALQQSGSAALPLVLVDGEVAVSGRYPSRDELADLAGLDAAAAWTPPLAGGRMALALAPAADGGDCCGGGGCC